LKKKGSTLAAVLMLLLLTLATVSVCSASPARPHRAAAVITPVDVGNNNDYGGGGGGGGGGGNWGGTDWGTDNHSTSSSSGGDFYPGGLIGGLVVLVVVIFVLKGNKNRGSIPAAQAPSHTPGNHETEIVPAIQAIDPNFSRDSFINWGNEVFITLQQAWTARDWAKIRPFEKEELFRQHEMQLQEYIDTGRINIIGRINIRQAYLHRYQRDAQYEYLTVYMETRMTDYIIDEKTKNVVKGDPNRDYFLNYLLTYMRKTGVKTDPARSNRSTVSCPDCGAPVSVTSAGRCEYCDFIITTGEHDWVLSSLDGVKTNTSIDERGVILMDDSSDHSGTTPQA